MPKQKPSARSEFDTIILLIQDARNRAFRKVNEEQVLLYFNVGEIVSKKVAAGAWAKAQWMNSPAILQ